MGAFGMNFENSKALDSNPKKLFTLALVFVAVSLAVFVLTIIFFKLFGAQKNSTARVSVQAITCSVALVAYFFLRKKIVGEKIPDFSLPKIGRLLLWTSAGLVFSIVPYFIAYDFDRIIWGNFRAELIFAATVFSLSAAIFEEILHRDLLFRFLLSRFHLWVAFFGQLFLFVGVHFFIYKITWINCLSLGIAGILFSLLWLLTKDFIASMLAQLVV